MTRTIVVTLMLFCLRAGTTVGQRVPQLSWGEFNKWGDQGNGYYKNPVLPADFSDVDCIRVGKKFYAISSTFQFSPGMVVLQSKDLVNWVIAGHVVSNLNDISEQLNWSKMNRSGKGIWAGAIRFHNNKFWVYFGTPDEGYFMTTAEDIKGPWQPLQQVLREAGWDDCCPFWDDDGQEYLVGTNFKDDYSTWLFRLTPDGKRIIPASGKIINRGAGREANKLYKIHGYYYHLFSEHKQGVGRYLMMQRSKNIYGPYKEVKQLSHAQPWYNEPNQGGLVDTKKGSYYFYTHHGTGDWSGRINSLLPVTWISGWPVIGKPGPDSIGSMVWSGKKPVSGTRVVTPQTSDEFRDSILKVQWEWNYQPRAEKWSLQERKGWLRLHAFQPLSPGDFFTAGNTLTQRSWRTDANRVIVKLDLSGMADGQKAGLCHFAIPNFATLGVVAKDSAHYLLYQQGDRELPGPVLKSNTIWLQSTWGLSGLNRYSYSLDGNTFIDFGDPYQLTWGGYRGDRTGIFTYNNHGEQGFVDIDFFHYDYKRLPDK